MTDKSITILQLPARRNVLTAYLGQISVVMALLAYGAPTTSSGFTD